MERSVGFQHVLSELSARSVRELLLLYPSHKVFQDSAFIVFPSSILPIKTRAYADVVIYSPTSLIDILAGGLKRIMGRNILA